MIFLMNCCFRTRVDLNFYPSETCGSSSSSSWRSASPTAGLKITASAVVDWPDFCPELALAKDLEVALEGTKVLEQASTEANKVLDQASISKGLEQGKVGSTEVSKGLDQAKAASMEETTKDSEEMGLRATRFVVS